MKRTILLIDDNTEMLEAIAEELLHVYEVVTSTNGTDAMEILKHGETDIVICDVMMPIMDGFEFCKNVKSNWDLCHVPVILLTAKNSLQSRITGLELGADAYIEKPFNVEHLMVQIANLIANRDKLRTYFVHKPLGDASVNLHSSADEKFLQKINEVVLSNLDDENLDIDKLATLMNTSRTTLFRRIGSISMLTPNELINVTRLKKAAQLLEETELKMYEIAYNVGFRSQTSFGRSFYKQYGATPTDYQKEKRTAK